ncbi:MAG: PhzF family phenazine biosynthesis protein [Desulfovibrio sp.]
MQRGALSGLEYRQVDVFAEGPLSGNGLAVFFDCGRLDSAAMQALTREMRQFESIFLQPGSGPDGYRARLFTMEEELDFAGHPVLGAACALHERLGGPEERAWSLELNARSVSVVTRRCDGCYEADMDQGLARMEPPLTPEQAAPYLAAMGIRAGDVPSGLPLQVVSTGLPYLILPVSGGLERVRLRHENFEERLSEIGAKFAYVLDATALEGRTWDNAGLAEDAATGSAAGPVGAYLAEHGRIESGVAFTLRQGRFVHRPSALRVLIQREGEGWHARVSGRVVPVASGRFDERPGAAQGGRSAIPDNGALAGGNPCGMLGSGAAVPGRGNRSRRGLY